jgi:hypothetical protein
MAASSDTPGNRHASPEELAAYALDSPQLNTLIREHVSNCSVCKPEAAWMQATVQELDQYPRCPSVDALVRFALGESPAEEQVLVAAHLRTCSACTQEVEWTRMTFAPAPVEEPAFVAIRRVVATLFSPPAVLGIGLRGDGERGSAESTTSTLLYKAEDLEITLSIEAEGSESYLVAGVILKMGPVTQVPGVEPMALLYALPERSSGAEPALIAEALVTPGNDFDLHAVPAGFYRLDLIYGDQVITLQGVAVP